MMSAAKPPLNGVGNRHYFENSLESIKEDYRSSLSDLTFNSKPIINTLTIIAHENMNAAPAIVSAIEGHFMRTIHKLPALYLIDSICKNLPHSTGYIELFSKIVIHLFIEGYKSVDEKTKREFLRVLQTWHHVFSREIIRSIEDALLKNDIAQYNQTKPSSTSSSLRQIIPKQTVSSSSSISYKFDRKGDLGGRAGTVSKQRPSPKNAIYQDNLDHRDSGYFHQMGGPGAYPSPNMPVGYSHPSPQQTALLPMQPHQQRLSRPLSMIPPFSQTGGPYPYSMHSPEDSPYFGQPYGGVYPNLPERMYPFMQPPISYSHPSPGYSDFPPPPKPPLMEQDKKTKRKNAKDSTVVGKKTKKISSTSSATPKETIDNAVPVELLSQLQSILESTKNLSTQSSNEPKETPVSKKSRQDIPYIELTYHSILKKMDGAYISLYNALPLQCPNCGLRFSDSEEGRATMDFHLDCHFKRNRRLNEKDKKIYSRDWFLSEQSWIQSTAVTESEKAVSSFFDDDLSPNKNDRTESKSPIIAKKISSSVIDKDCEICGEPFQTSFDSDADDWVVLDAIQLSIGSRKAAHIYCMDDNILLPVKVSSGATTVSDVGPYENLFFLEFIDTIFPFIN